MSLKNHSKFYYGFSISALNNKLDFKEGSTVFQATLNVGEYTLTTILAEIKRALEVEGAYIYTVTVDRTTRIVTIASASGLFSLLPVTGDAFGTSPFGLLGFTTDRNGVSTASGNRAAGFVYTTQFWLQEYLPSSQNKGVVDSVVNKAANGRVQVVSFGTQRFTEFNITMVTNYEQHVGSFVRGNTEGLENLIAFMEAAIAKQYFEFMENENDSSSFESLLLEETPGDKKGTSFKIKELYDRKMPGFFESGLLKFRVVEL